MPADEERPAPPGTETKAQEPPASRRPRNPNPNTTGGPPASGATPSSQPDTGESPLLARLRRWRTIRDDPGHIERLLLGTLFILLVLLVWHLLTRGEGDERIINAYTLPSPEETAKSFPSLWFDRALMRSVAVSLGRVLGGFLLAAAVAIPLGVIAGCYPRFHAFLRPISIFGRNTPIAALIPLTLIWFGLGEMQKVMFIFLAAVAFIFFDTTQSIRGVPGNYLDTAYTLGARPAWKAGLRRALLFGAAYALLALLGLHWVAEDAPTFGNYLSMLGLREATDFSNLARESLPGIAVKTLAAFVLGTLLWLPIHGHQAIGKVLFPLALPHIVNSLRLLFGLAFGYIMLAEVINAERGIGKIIIMSQRIGPREHIYLSLIVIAIIAFLLDRIAMWLQRRAFPYVTHGN
jgi:NitT/TauT family transport system permease protein